MAAVSKWSTAARNLMMEAIRAVADGAFLDIYNSTEPTDADTAVGAQVKLVRFTLQTPAFPAASGGVITANGTPSATNLADGTAAWYRLLESNGTTVIQDGNVATATACIVIDSTTIGAGATSTLTAFTLSAPATGA